MSCRGRRKNRFRYSRALSWLRYGILVLFLVAMIAHFKPVSNLLAPYSAYGRIVSNLFAPLYQWGNNLLAYLAERAGSYAFYTVDVWVKGAATLAVAAVTFIVLAVLAWRNGRTAWTAWGNAARERSPFRANPLPAANPLPRNLRP